MHQLKSMQYHACTNESSYDWYILAVHLVLEYNIIVPFLYTHRKDKTFLRSLGILNSEYDFWYPPKNCTDCRWSRPQNTIQIEVTRRMRAAYTITLKTDHQTASRSAGRTQPSQWDDCLYLDNSWSSRLLSAGLRQAALKRCFNHM